MSRHREAAERIAAAYNIQDIDGLDGFLNRTAIRAVTLLAGSLKPRATRKDVRTQVRQALTAADRLCQLLPSAWPDAASARSELDLRDWAADQIVRYGYMSVELDEFDLGVGVPIRVPNATRASAKFRRDVEGVLRLRDAIQKATEQKPDGRNLRRGYGPAIQREVCKIAEYFEEKTGKSARPWKDSGSGLFGGEVTAFLTDVVREIATAVNDSDLAALAARDEGQTLAGIAAREIDKKRAKPRLPRKSLRG